MGVLAEPVLVGRTRELEQLYRYLELAANGRGMTVFVSGEAGTGKTRLVTDFLNAAKKKKDISVLSGWCLSGAGIPYFPFMEAFSAYFSSPEKTKASGEVSNDELEINLWLKGPVVTRLSDSLNGTSAEAWKEQTFGAIRRSLGLISALRPTILFIDDIQWADSASLALLHYLSRTVSTNKVLIIATFRSEDVAQNQHGQPLSETLHLMSRENLFLELKLSGLDLNNVGLLAEHMIGGSVESSLAERLLSESQGNPLFVVESLRMLYEKKCLLLKRNKWCLTTNEVGVPTKIKDIILNRVSRLTSEQRKVLDVASVLGTKFSPELLASVLGKDALNLLEMLDSIAQVSSLVASEGPQYRFDHAKSRDAIYEDMSPALRKAYHARIAEKLEANLQGNRVSDLAYHYRGSENLEKAIYYSLAAGEEALKLVLGTEAIKHFSYVIENTKAIPDYSNERATAMEGLADGLYANANSESVEVYEKLCRNTSAPLANTRALRKAAYASLMEGNYGHALELINRPLENPLADKIEDARFHLVKGMIEAWGGYVQPAIADLQEAFYVFGEEFSLVDAIEALSQFAITYIMERSPDNSSSLGQPEKALASALCSHALAEQTKNVSKQVEANKILFIIYNKCGLLKEAIEVVEENFNLSKEIGDPISRSSNLTWVYWMSGYLAESRAMQRILSKLPLDTMQSFGTTRKLRFYMSSLASGALSSMRQNLNFAINESLKGVEYAEEADFFEIQAFNYENLTREYSELGQRKKAKIYYEKMEKIFDQTSLSGFIFANITHLFTKAVYFQCMHDWDKANRFYEEAIAYYQKISPGTGIMAGIQQAYCWALLQQGRFKDAKEQFQAAKEIYDELENRLVHSNILAFVLAPARVEVGKQFNIRIDIINVAKNSASLLNIKDLVPAEFQVKASEPEVHMETSTIDMRRETINSFQDKPIVLTVEVTKAGIFNLSPNIVYVDDLNQNKSFHPQPVKITAQPTKPIYDVLPGRLNTGSIELDELLLGGIPQGYALALVAPSSDERELLIKNFIDAGVGAGETTLYVTCEAGNAEALAQQNAPPLSLVVCNPQADLMAQNQPNVVKLKGIESLTAIDIAIMKYLRSASMQMTGNKRACVDLISDVLLQHHAVMSRKWLSSFLLNLKSKGFTILAAVDPSMHPSEEANAVLGLFDGEIRISEEKGAKGIKKTIRVLRLQGQSYLKKEITVGKN